jgi:hypothetical protein
MPAHSKQTKDPQRAREDRLIEEAKQILRRRGGEARAAKLSAARRREIARMGGLAKAAKRPQKTRQKSAPTRRK